MKKTLLLAAMFAVPIAACNPAVDTAPKETTSNTPEMPARTQGLSDILAAQKDSVKARYAYRNPKETIEYFGIAPGMTVAEVLPGGGWYSSILLPYLGDEGHLIGVDYSIPMWGKFGGFATPEFLEKKKSWPETWTTDAKEWRGGANTKLSAFAFDTPPKDLKNSTDVVVLIRALHHLNRFDQAHLAGAMNDIKYILKPDGIVGIVQHRGGEDQSDVWAGGDNGYMKQSYVIAIMDKAGFELAGDPSEINGNPKDQAKSDDKDKVWRLPPTLGTSKNDPELQAKMEAIGETDRMTLKFRLKK